MSDNASDRPATSHPPISSSAGNQPQETLLMRGAFDPPSTPGTLGRVDRFEILRLLGEGGMGQVYLAREPLTDTPVAIKIMKPNLAADPQSVHRFLTEARHMYRLAHPWILRVLEVSNRKEGPYYVMPFIAGGSLQTQYQPGQPLPEARVLAIARQVAEALAHAHAHGLIHRDLKPGNVLLDKEGNAFLTDFGLVRTVFNDSMVDASASHLEGTAPYMSPAVARGEAEDTRCDIYAFGALLYELLAGQPPYAGRTPQMILDQIVKDPPPPLQAVNPKANPALITIAEGCMARELRDRYASMADVVIDLARVAKGATPRGPTQQRHPFRGLAILLLGMLVVALLVGIVALLHLAKPTRPGTVTNPTNEVKAAAPVSPAPAVQVVAPIAPETPVAPTPIETDPYQFACFATNGTVAIGRYTGNGGVVAIPEKIDDLPVTAIRERAFFNCTNLTDVVIANTVTNIDRDAFNGCSGLVRLTIGRNVLNLADGAFANCTKLTHVRIPASTTFIGEWTFAGCTNMVSILVDLTNPFYSSSADGLLYNKDKTTLLHYPQGRCGPSAIPMSVTRIGPSAFRDCARLTNIAIPNGVNAIDPGAFAGCESLGNTVLPASLNSLAPSAFAGCRRLSRFSVDLMNASYCDVDGVIFSKDKCVLIRYPPGKNGDYEIPACVSRIAANAFDASPGLLGVTIPNGVTALDHWTFVNCTNLVRVALPERLSSVGWYAFQGCARLIRLRIPPSLTGIGLACFYGCSNLRSLEGPLHVPSIEDWMFTGCENLEGIVLSTNTTRIGYVAFAHCRSLTNITVGNCVTSFGNWAFWDCTNLTRVYFNGNASSGASDGSIFAGDSKATVYYLPGTTGWGKEFGGRPTVMRTPPASEPFTFVFTNGTATIAKYTGSGGDVVVPETVLDVPVNRIGDRAFENCTNLTSVSLPSSVVALGDGAFANCVTLTNLNLGAGIERIGGDAFAGCTALRQVWLPASVTTVPGSAFFGCSNLFSIAVDPKNPTLSSASDGVLFDKSGTALVRYPSGKPGPYAIPAGVTNIVGYAISGSAGLTELGIPASVSAFGCNDMTHCGRLSVIRVSEDNPVYSSDSNGVVFTKDRNTLLRYPTGRAGPYEVPSHVTRISGCGFEGCDGLTRVKIPATVKELEAYAFKDSTNLASVILPEGLTAIRHRSFWGCSALAEITIPDSVTQIGECAFIYCPNLGRVTLGKGVSQIDCWGFGGCASLTAVVARGSAPNCHPGAFWGTGNATIYYRPGTTGWGATLAGRPTAVWTNAPPDSDSPAAVPPLPFTCTTNGETITIAKYTGPGGAVVIPGKIEGLPVTSIGASAFMHRGDVTSVTIPGSVTNIGWCAFFNCWKLPSIVFPQGLLCIGNQSFSHCAGLTNVVIPDSVTSIEVGAFWNCANLTQIAIPASVGFIGPNPFAGSGKQVSITVDPANPVFCSLDGVLFNKARTSLISYPSGKSGSYEIPRSVTNIGDVAFGECAGLTRISIPNRVTSIGSRAFVHCTGLTNVMIPKSVTSIEGAMFYGCRALTSITVDVANPSYSSSADGVLFDKQKSCLVSYPAGKTGSYQVPAGVCRIAFGAFRECPHLTSVTVPEGVTNLCGEAFMACANLTAICFEGNAPSIDGNVLADSPKTTIYYRPDAKGWGNEFGGRPVVMRNVQGAGSDAGKK